MLTIEPIRCRIPEHLRRMGQNATWLGEVTGFGKPRISEYSSLRKVMSLNTSAVVAHYLKCSIDDLYDWKISGVGRE